MPGWFRSRAADYALLLATAAALTLPNLGGPSLWDVDEGVNAEAGREMAEAGTWVIPTFNFELRTAKPVMQYWLLRASYAAFGVSEWSARFVSVACGALTVLLTYELARRMFGRATGLLSGIVLASAVEVCLISHAATPDPPLLLFTVLTYLLFWVGHANGGRGWWAPCAAACGLAGLTKGPVGVALPGLVFLLYFAWNRELGRLLDRRIGRAVAVLLLVAGPWYGLVAAETRGAWPKAFFLNENLNRALTPMENHRGPVFYHAVALLALFAPWSAFLGGTLTAAWVAARGPAMGRRALWARFAPRALVGRVGRLAPQPHPPGPPLPGGEGGDAPQDGANLRAGEAGSQEGEKNGHPLPPRGRGPGGGVDRPYRFLLCWFAAYLVVFSLVSTKLPNYVLPLYPALAILTARYLVCWRDGELAVRPLLTRGSVAAVALVGFVTAVGLLAAGGVVPVPKMRTFPGLERWAALGLIPLAGAAAMAWRLRAGDRRGFVAAMAVSAVAFVASLAAFVPAAMDRYKAPRALVADARLDDPTRDIRVASYDWFQPSVVFYAKREVEKLPGPDAAAAFLATPTPGYLLIPEPTWAQWIAPLVKVPHRVAARRFDFYRNCDVLVVTNEP